MMKALEMGWRVTRSMIWRFKAAARAAIGRNENDAEKDWIGNDGARGKFRGN